MGDSASGIDSSPTACTLAGLGLVVPVCKTKFQQYDRGSMAQSSSLLLPKVPAKTVLKVVSIHTNLHQSSEKTIQFQRQCLLMLAA